MKDKMGKILLLTGVTGKKSGSAFVDLLVENKDIIDGLFSGGIRIVARESSDTNNIEKKLPLADIYNVGVDNSEKLIETFSDVDTIVHIAGIHFSRNIVDAAVKCKVRRLILVHTTGIYSKYKAAGEEYRQIDSYVYEQCRKNNIILTICRPTMIYGNVYDQNVVKFIKMIDKLPIMPVVNGANYALQPVHYFDLAKAYFDILINEEITANKDFVLSGKQPIMLRQMFVEIGNNLNKKIRFVSCPFPIAFFGAWLIYLLSLKKIDYREKVQRLCEPRVYSYEYASKTFGYNPMSFEEGIVEEVREYRELQN